VNTAPGSPPARAMGQTALKSLANCLNINIYSYLETSGGKSSNLHLNVHFSTSVLFRHVWQLKTVVFLHWCLICAVLFKNSNTNSRMFPEQNLNIYIRMIYAYINPPCGSVVNFHYHVAVKQ
jgi:hypothetical protein